MLEILVVIALYSLWWMGSRMLMFYLGARWSGRSPVEDDDGIVIPIVMPVAGEVFLLLILMYWPFKYAVDLGLAHRKNP